MNLQLRPDTCIMCAMHQLPAGAECQADPGLTATEPDSAKLNNSMST